MREVQSNLNFENRLACHKATTLIKSPKGLRAIETELDTFYEERQIQASHMRCTDLWYNMYQW